MKSSKTLFSAIQCFISCDFLGAADRLTGSLVEIFIFNSLQFPPFFLSQSEPLGLLGSTVTTISSLQIVACKPGRERQTNGCDAMGKYF
jgi:hypothetical protein